MNRPEAWFAVPTERNFGAARFYGWPGEIVTGDQPFAASPVATIVDPMLRRSLRAALHLATQPAAPCLPEHLRGDGPCSNCGTLDNIVWFTDSVFWNAVVRTEPRLTDDAEILCILCFVKMADDRGYRCNWRLTPEWRWETNAEAATRREESDQ